MPNVVTLGMLPRSGSPPGRPPREMGHNVRQAVLCLPGTVVPGYLVLCCFDSIGGKRREEPRSPAILSAFLILPCLTLPDPLLTMRAWPVARSERADNKLDKPSAFEANRIPTI